MAHDYSGQDSSGLSIGSYIAGKGYWVTITVPDDGDDRDAGNVSVSSEGVADRTVWIAWRMVNGLEGGTYPGNITWTGNHTFSGSSFTCNVSDPDFYGGLHVHSGTTTIDAAMNVAGAATMSGGAAFPAGSVVQFGDAIIHSGNDAYRSLRKATGADDNVTVQPWKADLWIAPKITVTSKTWTLDAPPGGAVVQFTIHQPDNTGGISLVIYSNAVAIATFGVGNLRAGTFIYDGTSQYRLISSIAA